MSVREYIGARYVPVFADPIQWDSTLKYEPLTVVTNEGASYVSRRYVPEGIQLDNTDYWVLWADFNAQLQHYINVVEAFDGRIDDLEDNFPITSAQIQNNTITSEKIASHTITDANIEQKHMVLIGDSFTKTGYGLQMSDMWWRKYATIVNLIPHSYAINGMGFIQGLTTNEDFRSQIDLAIADSSFDNSKVEKLFIMGGINDCRISDINSPTNYQVRVREVLNYAASEFPNAEIILVGCNTFDKLTYEGQPSDISGSTYYHTPGEIARAMYKAAAGSNNTQFIDITSLFIGATSYFGSDADGHHPNIYGQNALLTAVMSGRANPVEGKNLEQVANEGTGTSAIRFTPNGAVLYIHVSATYAYNGTYQGARFEDTHGILQFAGIRNLTSDDGKVIGFGKNKTDISKPVLISMTSRNTTHGAVRILTPATTAQELEITIPLYL